MAILPVQITVGAGGSNPTAGSDTWSNPAIAGQAGYLEKVGYGPLRYDDYIILPGGGVQLLNGLIFGANETYFWHPVGVAYETAAGSYTNGFDYSAVMAAMVGRIGFRPHTEIELAGLVDSTNQISRSGRYFNDFHTIVSAGNIAKIQPDAAISNVNFNAYLQSLQKSAIMRALTAVFSEKEYLEQKLVFDTEYDGQDESIANTGRFVGFEIRVPERPDVAVQIDGANLLFDGDLAAFPLYLFKQGKKSPVWSTTVNVTAHENSYVSFSDLVLKYISTSTRGSRFFFGYFQDDLGVVKAIRRSVCWEDVYCFGIQGMEAVALPGNYFDRTGIAYTLNSYGVNLEVSAFTDHTNTIAKKAFLFDELVGLSMAASVVESALYSTRSNGTERILKAGLTEASLMQELNGTAPVSDGPPPILGLKQRLDREAARVKKSLYKKPISQTVNLADDD